jgi:histidinol phosphatase-like PHP family hydrolase
MEKLDFRFPLIDYHVHFGDDFGIDQAVELSQRRNVKFGILDQPGPQHRIESDDDLKAYIHHLRQYPVYVGLQPIYLGWARDFSQDVIDQLDYVLMDADTIPQGDGDYLRIWRRDLFIADMDEFMNTYMNHIVRILESEPITIFARPTYLPINFARYYNEIWDKKRMMTIIDLAKERNIALEIQENTQVPCEEFIRLAKKAGIKFTFGTNARNHNAGNFNYCIRMAKACELTEQDMLFIEKN